MKQDVTVELAGGKRLTFETGRMAKQASGAALVTQGDTVVLATAVASPDPREGIDFFPLTVDYREYAYAGGRIPGGFIKREGRPSEREVLTCRQIDRPIRPLFPEGFRNETQVIALVFSADKENDPDIVGINAASCALALSDIPFGGPVGAVRIGQVNGEFIVNPTYAERLEQRPEHYRRRHQRRHRDGGERIQRSERRDGGRCHRFRPRRDQEDCCGHRRAGWQGWQAEAQGHTSRVRPGILTMRLSAKISDRLKDALDTKTHPKIESYALVKHIKDELAKELPEGDADAKKKLAKYYEHLRETIFREQVTKDRIRPDRRAFDEIRAISIEVGVLPRTHGSALFTRGETQALGYRNPGHHRRFAAARDLRGRAEEALHAALQLPAVLGGRRSVA